MKEKVLYRIKPYDGGNPFPAIVNLQPHLMIHTFATTGLKNCEIWAMEIHDGEHQHSAAGEFGTIAKESPKGLRCAPH